jgi:hypothetical protein
MPKNPSATPANRLVKTLSALLPGGKMPAIALTKEEGEEIIRARRRGVKAAAIALAIGKGHSHVYFALGTWAVSYAVLPEDHKK